MKKKLLILVPTIFIAITTIGAESDALDSWQKTVSTNDFKKMLSNVKSFREDWPTVHSVKHRENKESEKAVLQENYRNVARTFLHGLENYEKELRNMSPEAFCDGADALLDVRERFIKHPSYVNYFLVDSINRVIYVNLGERLANVGDIPVCYDRIVERLSEFRCDWTKLYELVSGERDTDLVLGVDFENLSLNDKIQMMEKMVGQENFFFIVQDGHNLYSLRILDKRSLTALLARLVWSDHVIGASLPALLFYRRKATNFVPTDSLDQIRLILGDETRLSPTLLCPTPSRIASVVDTFLRETRSEKWRMMLYFSDPPVFTKEFLERAEKEEAEREAKREAQEAQREATIEANL